MPTFQRIFVVSDVAAIHTLFLRNIEDARRADLYRQRADLPPITLASQRALLIAFNEFNVGLRAVADRGARNAQTAMRDRLSAYISATGRGPTGRRPNLKMKTTARRLPTIAGVETGAVGVAPEEVLDTAVNPDTPGYGTYWRAIEFGTGSRLVQTQVGRRIRGFFTGPSPGYADPTRPARSYTPQPIFLPGSTGDALGLGGIGVRGGRGGSGVIQREIRPANFIRDGANEALIEWRRELAQLELRTLRAIGGAGPLP